MRSSTAAIVEEKSMLENNALDKQGGFGAFQWRWCFDMIPKNFVVKEITENTMNKKKTRIYTNDQYQFHASKIICNNSKSRNF